MRIADPPLPQGAGFFIRSRIFSIWLSHHRARCQQIQSQSGRWMQQSQGFFPGKNRMGLCRFLMVPPDSSFTSQRLPLEGKAFLRSSILLTPAGISHGASHISLAEQISHAAGVFHSPSSSSTFRIASSSGSPSFREGMPGLPGGSSRHSPRSSQLLRLGTYC